MNIAFKELKYYKFKYLLIGLILFLLAFLVMFVSSLAQGLGKDNISMIENLNGDHILVHEEADNQINQSVLEDKDTKLAEDNGYHFVSMKMLRIQEASAIQLLYSDDAVNYLVVEGHEPKSDNEILLDETLSKTYAIGDTIQARDYDDVAYEVSGFVEKSMYAHTSIGFVTKEGYKKVDENVTPTFAVGDKKIETPKHIDRITKQDAMNGIPSFQAEQLPLNLMVVFLFVISAIVISAFFYVITIQKTKEYGILKAIGTTSGKMITSIIVVVMTIVILSTVIAIGLTFVIGQFLPVTMPFFINENLVLLLFGSFVGVSLIGALLSVFKVIRIDPLSAIGGE
ncbi:ABC transporter permease [Phocicoccus pinnipedialis]|uniref:Putative hemin transport system permease protein HrtB n=1 Tax=Phocicoccus pinnipedialis TaxID=110845 RepID=A0A6V7R3U8_9BACL|nr:ABC transporter permease [Jeotgalicoccus pinnipedialis]MBP1940011.1 hemin transport system permease protein [Jeotgalicoccus pinnipedialis]CAD2072041.1 FtsX-like permease family protein [Jeotgalicoccus pinnipedialis]